MISRKVDNKQNKNGFTLVEILLYVACASLLLLALSFLWIELLAARGRQQAIIEVNEQGTALVRMINQEIRSAQNINLPAIGTSGVILSLTSDDLFINPLVFDASSTTIRLSEAGGAAMALTNSKVLADSLIFYNQSKLNTPGLISFSFHLRYDDASGRREYQFDKTFQGTAALRQP